MTGAELRASILQAAVQGKLVPQDPNDEPASKLLERIREERRELVKQKKAKAPRGGESVITRYPDGTVWEQRGTSAAVEITDEVPFDIPDGWEWARIGSLIEIERGGSPRPIKSYITTREDGINWIKIGDTDKDGKYITQTREKIRAEGMKKSRYVVPGDFLLTNSMSFGRPYILQTDGCIHDGWLVFRKPDTVFDKDYLYWLLSSPAMFRQFAGLAAGSAVKNLNIDKVKDSFVPVPPLAEQQRIVAKLDELMPLVERYDKLDCERTELNAGIEGAMRASILQAAVQGQLTEREDGDEPASKLLEQRGKASLFIDEEPFELPDGWCWARYSDIADLERGAGIKRSEVVEDGEPCVRYGELYTTYGQEISVVVSHTSDAVYEKAHKLEHDDVLMTLTGENDIDIGKAVFNNTGGTVAYGGDLLALKNHCMDGRFLMFATNADYVREQRTANASGKIIVHLSGKKIGQFVIAVPPLAEQRRIVAKLDELLPKTEKLGKLVS